MSGLRLVPPSSRMPFWPRLRERLTLRFYRCSGCRAVVARRFRPMPPEHHAFPCGAHQHHCGKWERVDRHALCAQRHRLSPIGERFRIMRDN